VKGTTGNPVVIEKQDGSFIMYYKDKYVWTEENCEWDRWLREWVCETITHTEYWIYKRTSSDGLVWGSPSKVRQAVLSVRNIAAIQKQNGTFLMCYTDKVGSSYYIRQITSTNGTSWGSPSNVVKVNSSTGNPTLLQADSGVVYLAYRKGSYVYVMKNAGSGWSSPVQTTAVAEGDPALLQTESEIVLIYKGTDDKCYRISSADGSTWSTPSQIAPNKALTSPSTVDRKDRFYRVTAQYISESLTNLVKVTEYSYEGNNYLSRSTDVVIKDAQTLKSSMHFEYDSKGRTIERISKDEQGTQTEKVKYTYNNSNRIIRQDVYAGTSSNISYSVIVAYDNQGNIVYTKGPEGAEQHYSYANTSSENQFVDSKGSPVNLFSNQFYSNSIPSECHTLIVGEAFINNGKVAETYYKYDTNGNLTETKTLYPTRDYTVFSGEFDENGQTTFEFDLTGKTITDGILVISSIAVPTQETFYETHSEVGKGWLNTGSWSGKYFMADYYKCYDMECWDGETKIGPFEHYPGTPGYTGYTKWVEDNRTQYVETSYTQIVNEYPAKTEYNLNSNGWTTITNDLGSGTTSTTISAASFVQGLNTLQFKESNAYSTKFDWVLYLDQGSTPQEYVTNFTYDNYGNMTSITDAKGNTAFLGYDSHHLYLTSLINPLNQVMSATYDFNTGLIITRTNPKGNTTSYEYDALGRVTKKINPDLTEKEVIYNDQDNYAIIYDELDNYTTCYYDGINRLVQTEWHLSPSTTLVETYTYNYLNRVITMIDPKGEVYSFEYDSYGRTTKIINPDLTFREKQYTDSTNTMKIFDENQNKIEYQYDWTGNLIWVKEYTGSVDYYLTEYTYDDLNNVTAVTDPKGNTTLYEYGLFGIEQIVYPDTTQEALMYDSIGNLIQKTAGDKEIFYSYNDVSQLLHIDYPGSSVFFTYDENGNRISMTDSQSAAGYTYDSRDRLISETKTINGIDYTTSYVYDGASNVTSVTYPDGTVIPFAYDTLNRIQSVDGYAQFVWDETSQVNTILYQNGITTEYVYDTRGRPEQIATSKNGTDFLNLTYAYDAAGNILHMKNEDSTTITEQWDYTYDSLNRLKTAAGGPSGQYSLNYQYDSTGNRIQLNSTVYTYNDMNELLSFESPDKSSTFLYDIYGNSIQKDTNGTLWDYTYDYENRLVSVKKDGHIVEEYEYDGDGNRIKKVNTESERIYIYSGLNILYEVNTTTQMDALYIYGPTGRIAKKVNNITEYYHTDHLGSTKLVTSENGTVTEEILYKPFGEQINVSEEKYTYNGKERDETGLYYYGARYYDPAIGRFITRDPVMGKKESPQTLNRYVYCINNPLTYVDPAGTDSNNTQETVEEIFRRLQAVNPDELKEIQAALDNNEIEPVDALKKVLELLGFEVKEENDALLIEVSEGDWFGIKIDNTIGDWGTIKDNNILINFTSGKVGDMTLTILHEVSHAVLGPSFTKEQDTKQHLSIYNVEYSYLIGLSGLGVEFSSGEFLKGEKNFMRHIKHLATIGYVCPECRVPISEIIKGWTIE
jgi:RHS repeat-associated protein